MYKCQINVNTNDVMLDAFSRVTRLTGDFILNCLNFILRNIIDEMLSKITNDNSKQ